MVFLVTKLLQCDQDKHHSLALFERTHSLAQNRALSYGVVGNFHAVDVQQCASLGDAGQCGDILDTLCLTCDGPSTNVCTSR